MRKLLLCASIVALAACGNKTEREIFTVEYPDRPAVEIAENENMNAYFGDLHVHTQRRKHRQWRGCSD